MAISKYACYIYDSNNKLIKQGKVVPTGELPAVYVFSNDIVTVVQGEISATRIIIAVPENSFTDHTPFMTVRTPQGWHSQPLIMVKDDVSIDYNGSVDTYQIAYINLSLVGLTRYGGKHMFSIGWLTNGAYVTLEAASYTVDDGVNDYEDIEADYYEEISIALEATFVAYADRVIAIENYLLGAFEYANGQEGGVREIVLYNLAQSAILTFDGTKLVITIDGTDYSYALLSGTNTFTAVNTFVLQILAQAGINVNSSKIVNVANGTTATDAINKGQHDLKADKTYVDSQDNALDARVTVNEADILALETANMFKSVSYASTTGILTFTKYDDTTTAVDFPLELIVESGSYDAVNNEIVLVLADSSEIRIPVGELLTDLDATNVRYDNATSGLTAESVQAAIDELENEKIDKDYSSYTELTTLAEDDEIIIRDVANSLTKKAKMSSLINYYGNSREYGVREVVGQSSPTLERVLRVNGLMTTGSATGLVANVGVDDSIVTNSFDSIAIFDREKVTISAGGVENVFVKVPKYYIKEEWTNESGTDYHYWWMCEYQLDSDYRLPLPFVTPEQTERDYAYIGAYEAYLDGDSKLRSISGQFPKVSYSRANFRTAARKLDTADSSSKYQITDVAEYVDLVQIPMLIEFATKNMQSVFVGASAMAYSDSHVATADGVASVGANTIIVANATGASFVVGQTIGIGTSRGGNQIASDRVITAIDADTPGAGSTTITYDGAAVQALTDHYVYSLGWKSGRLDGALSSSALDTDNSGKYGFAWRGIENPYANIWKNVDGVKIVDNQAWICTDPSQYDDTASSGGSYAYPYQKLSYVNHNANGYPTELGLDLSFPFAKFPTAIGAGSTTYYSDYYYQATGDRTAFVGGSWANGSAAGPFFWTLNYSLGYANITYGARLSYRP